MLLDARVETFLQVCDRGSFSAAGKALYLSAVSVMKRVDSMRADAAARGVKVVDAPQLLEQL